MENVVTNGDERWLAWIAANGWDPCKACDVEGYHVVGDTWEKCEACEGFGFIIPGMPDGSWHFGDKEE